MSPLAKAGGWIAGAAILGGWSFHHGRFDGQTLAVIVVLLLVVAVCAVHDIDTGRGDRLQDPRPLPYERGRR